MELPPRLRQAVDLALEGVSTLELAAAAKALSHRYRNEVRDGRLHLSDGRLALAYIATRMPATYAALRASLEALRERLPNFAPKALLDVGAGPGTALWAVRSLWPNLSKATLLEASSAIRAVGEPLAALSGAESIAWRSVDITRETAAADPAELVTLAYVLDELAPQQQKVLVDQLWRLTQGALLIVEPGTPAGWRRILTARNQLIASGAHLLAPCPHALDCPIAQPDWCHFSARVARSRAHRLAKEAEAPWEDEKFVYLAAARLAPGSAHARILALPHPGSGRVRLKLCGRDGGVSHRLVTRREGETFRQARRRAWGDVFEG